MGSINSAKSVGSCSTIRRAHIRRFASIALVTTIAAAGVCAGATSGAADTPFERASLAGSADFTRAPIFSDQDQLFDVWNVTGGVIKANDGTPILPGQKYQVSVPTNLSPNRIFSGTWVKTGEWQQWSVTYGWNTSGKWIKCNPDTSSTVVCGGYIGKNVAKLADQWGTLIVVPATDVTRQAQLRRDLCGNEFAAVLDIRCTAVGDKTRATNYSETITAGNTTWTLLS